MDSVHVLFDDAAALAMHNSCMADTTKKKLMDDVAKECGKRLAQCRIAKGLTQDQLSKATGYKLRRGGLSPSQISNFEQGTRRIRLEQAEILASVFTEYASVYFTGGVDEREAKMLAVLRTKPTALPKAL